MTITPTSQLPAQYQLLPSLTDDEFAALKADIAARGVMVPIELDEQGNVLDGHHRLQACRELGITEWPSIIRPGLTEDEKREHVLALNLDRRHLSKDQRDELVARLRADGWSLRRIAEKLNVGLGTVERAAAGVPNGTPDETPAPPAKVTGSDGKSYPSRKPAVFAPTPKAAEQVQKVLDTHVPTSTGSGPLTVTDLKREVKDAARATRDENDKAKAAEMAQETDRYRVFLADIRDLAADPAAHGIEPGTIDSIITDPPYLLEYLPLYDTLGALAKTVLKPGGSLIVMAGQTHFPAVLQLLIEHLDYHWLLSYQTPGGQSPTAPLQERRVNSFWKPVLWLCNGYQGKAIGDVVASSGNDKLRHKWGQSVDGFAELVERFSDVGETVFDPFCGGGATGKAAMLLGRRFLGSDIDSDCIASTLAAIAEVSE